MSHHGLGDDVLASVDALFADLSWVGVLSSKSNGSKDVHDQVDPEHLDRGYGGFLVAEGADDRDGEEEALDFSDELAELLDDGGPEEDAAEPVAERKAATAHAYGRATALGRSHFPQLLDALDGVPDLGPRHVALLEQAPDTRTAVTKSSVEGGIFGEGPVATTRVRPTRDVPRQPRPPHHIPGRDDVSGATVACIFRTY